MPERNDHRLAGGWLVERRDDLFDAAQILRIVGDHQRVAAGKGRDRVVRRDERAQHVDHLLRRFVMQRDDLGDQAIAAAGALRHFRAMHLGFGLEHELGHAIAFDRGDALQAQGRQQRRIDEAPRHRARRDDVDRALDAGIDDEIAPGDVRDRLHHRFDVGVDEVERYRVILGDCRYRQQCDDDSRPGNRRRTGARSAAGSATRCERRYETGPGTRV